MSDLSIDRAGDLALTPAERRRARADTAEPLWFDAVLRPHRSLGRRGFLAATGILAGISALVALRFWALGAWPVAVVFLLDAALIYAAFKLSYATARSFETLQLRPGALILTHVSWRGRVDARAFNPDWVCVELMGADAASADLVLSDGQSHAIVGRFLPPHERAEVAEALSDALARRKAGAPPIGRDR